MNMDSYVLRKTIENVNGKKISRCVKLPTSAFSVTPNSKPTPQSQDTPTSVMETNLLTELTMNASSAGQSLTELRERLLNEYVEQLNASARSVLEDLLLTGNHIRPLSPEGGYD